VRRVESFTHQHTPRAPSQTAFFVATMDGLINNLISMALPSWRAPNVDPSATQDLAKAANNYLMSPMDADWFFSHLVTFLAFGDLRNFSLCNKTNFAAVRSLISKWPAEIRYFLRTWCTEAEAAVPFIFARVPEQRYQDAMRIIRFDAVDLAYDTERNKLQGKPWSKVHTRGKLLYYENPNNVDATVCFANDSKTQLFFCGGTLMIPGDDNHPEDTFHDSRGAALLDIVSGKWTELPMMPMSRGGSAAASFRVGSKIFVFGGCEFTSGGLGYFLDPLCFDMKENRWVDPRLDYFPGHPYDYMRAVVLNHRDVIISTGCMFVDDVPESERWMEVFLLDVISGQWIRLEELPHYSQFFSGSHPDRMVVAFAGENWASLQSYHRTRWEENPDFRRTSLKAFSSKKHNDSRKLKVFAGDTWLDLPEVRINGKKIDLYMSNIVC
jgi:hypothetical protein